MKALWKVYKRHLSENKEILHGFEDIVLQSYKLSCKNPHFTADFLNIYAKFAYTRLKVFYIVFEELSDDIIFFTEKRVLNSILCAHGKNAMGWDIFD